ncbi:hypothetical protein FISHEDRAFT_76115 [Fistulina hepatica ATCC 64428]|uniref:Uncharacterized protein n=1 Tax=Fistulina hepatica ATCC 64428 TaxID=1128425 RepID=A0A0D7A4F2_9AGAR|nr:hypothetical protein FISHEDRAFT_76115 [Fistulina hepatica ATCC 64428]
MNRTIDEFYKPQPRTSARSSRRLKKRPAIDRQSRRRSGTTPSRRDSEAKGTRRRSIDDSAFVDDSPTVSGSESRRANDASNALATPPATLEQRKRTKPDVSGYPKLDHQQLVAARSLPSPQTLPRRPPSTRTSSATASPNAATSKKSPGLFVCTESVISSLTSLPSSSSSSSDIVPSSQPSQDEMDEYGDRDDNPFHVGSLKRRRFPSPRAATPVAEIPPSSQATQNGGFYPVVTTPALPCTPLPCTPTKKTSRDDAMFKVPALPGNKVPQNRDSFFSPNVPFSQPTQDAGLSPIRSALVVSSSQPTQDGLFFSPRKRLRLSPRRHGSLSPLGNKSFSERLIKSPRGLCETSVSQRQQSLRSLVFPAYSSSARPSASTVHDPLLQDDLDDISQDRITTADMRSIDYDSATEDEETQVFSQNAVWIRRTDRSSSQVADLSSDRLHVPDLARPSSKDNDREYEAGSGVVGGTYEKEPVGLQDTDANPLSDSLHLDEEPSQAVSTGSSFPLDDLPEVEAGSFPCNFPPELRF